MEEEQDQSEDYLELEEESEKEIMGEEEAREMNEFSSSYQEPESKMAI